MSEVVFCVFESFGASHDPDFVHAERVLAGTTALEICECHHEPPQVELPAIKQARVQQLQNCSSDSNLPVLLWETIAVHLAAQVGRSQSLR